MRINVLCEHCQKMTYASDDEIVEALEMAPESQLLAFREQVEDHIGSPLPIKIESLNIQDELKVSALKKLFESCTLQQIENIVNQFVKKP